MFIIARVSGGIKHRLTISAVAVAATWSKKLGKYAKPKLTEESGLNTKTLDLIQIIVANSKDNGSCVLYGMPWFLGILY